MMQLHHTAYPLVGAIAGLGILAGAAAPALSYTLGKASEYNVFVLGDYTLFATDVEGKLAVGGNLSAHTFGVGSKLTGDAHGSALIVGGDLQLSNGKVYGDAVYGGTAAVAENVGFEFLDASGQPIRRATLSQGPTLDFSSIGQDLMALGSTISRDAASSAATVTLEEYPDATLATLSGTDASLNIFNLTGDLFTRLRKLTFSVPDSSKIVVNVSGSAAKIADFGFYFGDQDCNAAGVHLQCRDRSRDILFNFPEAKLLEITRVGFMGSILAPKASIDFNNGHINGTLVAGSLAGDGETHLYLHRSSDTPQSPATEVPEPAALAGLTLLGLTLRYQRRDRSAA